MLGEPERYSTASLSSSAAPFRLLGGLNDLRWCRHLLPLRGLHACHFHELKEAAAHWPVLQGRLRSSESSNELGGVANCFQHRSFVTLLACREDIYGVHQVVIELVEAFDIASAECDSARNRGYRMLTAKQTLALRTTVNFCKFQDARSQAGAMILSGAWYGGARLHYFRYGDRPLRHRVGAVGHRRRAASRSARDRYAAAAVSALSGCPRASPSS